MSLKIINRIQNSEIKKNSMTLNLTLTVTASRPDFFGKMTSKWKISHIFSSYRQKCDPRLNDQTKPTVSSEKMAFMFCNVV